METHVGAMLCTQCSQGVPSDTTGNKVENKKKRQFCLTKHFNFFKSHGGVHFIITGTQITIIGKRT